MNEPYKRYLQKVVTALRDTTVPQIRGDYSRQVKDEKGNWVWGFCAMGLLRLQGLDTKLDDDMFSSIMDLNDEYRMSFHEIADWIQCKIDYPQE